MNSREKIEFKIMLQQKCINIIEERIHACYNAMENAQASANNEDKSSAGDKYETGRAMSHLEKDMHAKQLAAHKKDMSVLFSISCNIIYDKAVAGSFITCKEVSFFIGAGLGKIFIKNETVFLVSLNAPLAQLLYNKKINDSFLFMKKEIIIDNIF
jgi:hypothetical protein